MHAEHAVMAQQNSLMSPSKQELNDFALLQARPVSGTSQTAVGEQKP